MNRIEHLFHDPSPAEQVMQAGRESEAQYAAAVRAAASGEPFDAEELIQLGAGVGRPPGRVYIDLRIAGIAFEAWQNSVPLYFG